MKRRLRLFTALALAAAAGAGLAWLLLSEAALHWAFPRLRAMLPGTLEVGALHGRLAGPITVDRLHWRDGAQALRIGRATLDWSPLALLGLGVQVDGLAARDVELHLATAAGGDAPPSLPLWLQFDRLEVEHLVVHVGDAEPLAIEHIDAAGGWRAGRLRIGRLALRQAHAEIELAGQFSATAPYALDGTLRWRWSEPGRAVLEGHGTARGDARQLTLTHELVAPLGLNLRAVVEEPFAAARWRATGQIEHRVDAATTVRGELAAAGDRRHWRLERLHLTVPGGESTLDAEAAGGMSWEAPLQATLAWRALRWPLHAAARIASPDGRLTISGTAGDARAELTAGLQWEATPVLQIAAQVHSGRTRLRLARLTASGAAGTLTADGTLRWQPQLAWTLNYRARDVDPGSLWPQWPGKLALGGRFEGRHERDWSAAVTVDNLHGSLRGIPVSLDAAARLDGTRLRVPRFELRGPGAGLSISAELTDRWQARWRLQVDDLARLWPDAEGAVTGHGELRGRRERPLIDADITARAVAFDDYRIGSLDARLHLDLDDREASRATVTARELQFAGRTLRSLGLEAGGRLADHRLDVRAAGDAGALALAAAGGVHQRHWRGQLTALDLDHARAGRWRLESAAMLAVGRDRLQLDGLCWRRDSARLCGTGLWARADRAQLDLDIVALPLTLFDGWLPAALQLDGTLDASVQAARSGGGAIDGRLRAELSPGTVRYRSARGERESVAHQGGRLQLQAGGGRLRGSARLDLPAGGWLSADGGAAFRPFQATVAPVDDLDLRLRTEIPDLGPLAPDLDEVERLTGRLTADLHVTGRPADPQLRGEIRLRDGSARIARLGVRLTAIEARLRSADGRQVELDVAAHSGDGGVRARGEWRLDHGAPGRGRVQVTGENFELVKTHEAWLLVSPDLVLDFEPGQVRLDGRLRVPRGRLVPRDLTLAEHESPDTVGLDPAAAPAPAPARWALTANLRLTVEERMWFEGYGFAGWIAGDVTVEQAPQRPTTGRGELRVVAGHYTVYGRRLDIDRGRLLFTLSPIDDPALDVRALRRLPDLTVGVQAAGTLRRPELQLFSEPALNQTDILSYLLFGLPASQAGQNESGQLYQAAATLGLVGGEFLARSIGARFGIEEVRIESGVAGAEARLVLGTYLTPKLYVSYGIGLLEPINSLRLRYQLDPRWQIEAQSGTHQAADLYYTIER